MSTPASAGESSQELSIPVKLSGKTVWLLFSNIGLTLGVLAGRKPVHVSLTDVLWAGVNDKDTKLELSYIARKKGNDVYGSSTLVRNVYNVQDADLSRRWCGLVMGLAYKRTSPRRRIMVFVNPKGGPGKATQRYQSIAKPIFEAAHCEVDTTFTERPKHATELAKELDVSKYDVLALLSGDGLAHEVYQGFAAHAEPLKAFALPIAPVPTGSANGMALNLLGFEDGLDVALACLNAIKGIPMKQDICSLTFGDQRVFTYFSVALGMMADLDLGTESLRWMGDFRFVLGYLHGILRMRECPIKLEMKLPESDKDAMVAQYEDSRKPEKKMQHLEDLAKHSHETDEDLLPLLKHTKVEGTEGDWVQFDRPMLSFYSGLAPYVARDLMQFPLAHPSDGLIDIVVQEITSRKQLLSLMDSAHMGSSLWDDSQHYFKAPAYRITPLTNNGVNLSVDGERYEAQPFAVECHKGLGTFLSPSGHYAAEFKVPRPEKAKGDLALDLDYENRPVTKRTTLCC